MFVCLFVCMYVCMSLIIIIIVCFDPDGAPCEVLWRPEALDCREQTPPETCHGLIPSVIIMIVIMVIIIIIIMCLSAQPRPGGGTAPRC